HVENVGAVGREFTEPADRGNRHHSRQHRGEGDRTGGISRGGDARDALESSFTKLLRHELGEAVAHDADMDEIELPLDALVQRRQQIADPSVWQNLEYVQLGLGRATDDSLVGARSIDDAGGVRAVREEILAPTGIGSTAGEV